MNLIRDSDQHESTVPTAHVFFLSRPCVCVHRDGNLIIELLLTRERRILLRTASGASRFLYITDRYGSLFVDLQPHFGSRSRDTSHEHIARDPKASCEVARSNIDQI